MDKNGIIKHLKNLLLLKSNKRKRMIESIILDIVMDYEVDESRFIINWNNLAECPDDIDYHIKKILSNFNYFLLPTEDGLTGEDALEVNLYWYIADLVDVMI